MCLSSVDTPLGPVLARWPDLGHSNEGILGDMVQGFLEAHFFFPLPHLGFPLTLDLSPWDSYRDPEFVF